MNELTEHYAVTIRLIEQILLTRVPRWMRKRVDARLHADEVRAIAAQLAHAHQVAKR